MAETEPCKFPFVVTKHQKVEKGGEEHTIHYEVTLKPAATANVKGDIHIRSEMQTIFDLFPLNEEFSVRFTSPQKKLV